MELANKEYPINSKIIVGYGTLYWDILVDKESERIKTELIDTRNINPQGISLSFSQCVQKRAQQCEDMLVKCCKKHILRQQNLVALKISLWCIANNTIKAGMSKIESLTIDEK